MGDTALPSSRQNLIKRLDSAFSRYIRKRDGNRCVQCGSNWEPQCGHLISGRWMPLRWFPLSAFCQCSRCNYEHERDPIWYEDWYEKRWGTPTLHEFVVMNNKPKDFLNYQLEYLIEFYEVGLKMLP